SPRARSGPRRTQPAKKGAARRAHPKTPQKEKKGGLGGIHSPQLRTFYPPRASNI
ncbi:hypothetical protein HMPREF9946_04459, partial [Acetobacteraceae bacterium AT-5844]